MQQPLVSIIIPTYNRASRIITTLDSVFTQTYPNLEVIVVDDGSTDNTECVLNEYVQKTIQKNILFKFIKQDNSGAPAARNNGLRNAQGEYVCFFDSDDIMLPDRIEEQVSLMITEYSDCCACGFLYFYKQTESIPVIKKGESGLSSFFKKKLTGSTQSWMFTKSLVCQVGGYDESLSCRQDVDIVFRILTQKPRISVSQKILSVFVDHDSDTRIMRSMQKSILGYNSRIKYHSKIIDYCIENKEIKLLFTAVRTYCVDMLFTLPKIKYNLFWNEFICCIKRNQQYPFAFRLYISFLYFIYIHYFYFRIKKI
jgi:glycosyltransferase involved in cell wall biosynthesis